jgi:hypothetical protein
VIEPRPRRNRRCPHCRSRIFLRQGRLLTEADARAADAGPKGEAAPHLAAFKTFRSALSTWESLFTEAAEFVTQVGPDRLIGISHSADQGEGVVTVWYWTEPEWGGVGAPEESV